MSQGSFGLDCGRSPPRGCASSARRSCPRHLVGDFLDGEVELVAGHENRWPRRRANYPRRPTATLSADHADLEPRLQRLQGASATLTSLAKDGVEVCNTTRSRLTASGATSSNTQAVRRRVDQLAVLDKRRRLREPSRIPERAHLRGASDSVRRRRRHSRRRTADAGTGSSSLFAVPFDDDPAARLDANSWSRHDTLRPQSCRQTPRTTAGRAAAAAIFRRAAGAACTRSPRPTPSAARRTSPESRARSS